MSAGAAAVYPGPPVETTTVQGVEALSLKPVPAQITQQATVSPQSASTASSTSVIGATIQLVDGTALVPTEALIATSTPVAQQQQTPPLLHLAAPMATIVTTGVPAPTILVPSTQPTVVGPIAVTLAPAPGQVIDYAQLNGAATQGAEAVSTEGASEYYIQAAPTGAVEVMHVPQEQPLIMGGPAPMGEVPIPFDQLKQLLQTQLEYYFSR